MAVNRKLWTSQFESFPNWLCPHCQSGSLSLIKNTLTYMEPAYSDAAKKEDPWMPDWIEERFTALLQCANNACGEIVAVGGRTHHVEDHDWETQEEHWSREYQPVFLTPPPPVFPIPVECPEAVTVELQKAFGLLWSDPGSCANRLRAAVEALLTERRVPKKRQNKKKKWVRIDLHARIEEFRKKDAETADYLLALKWLGNVGSHKRTQLIEHYAANDLHNWRSIKSNGQLRLLGSYWASMESGHESADKNLFVTSLPR